MRGIETVRNREMVVSGVSIMIGTKKKNIILFIYALFALINE